MLKGSPKKEKYILVLAGSVQSKSNTVTAHVKGDRWCLVNAKHNCGKQMSNKEF